MVIRPKRRMSRELKKLLAKCEGNHWQIQPNARELNWRPETDRFYRIAKLYHTCDECSDRWYELCRAGGLFGVRRYTRDKEEIRVEEIDWLIWQRMSPIWQALYNGQAY